jgi:predicted dienelactone hydrolase
MNSTRLADCAITRRCWAVCAAALAACTAPPAAPPAREAPVREFAARGYAPATHDDIESGTHELRVAGQAVQAVLTLPRGARAAPLVVYLPGLGESAEAGAVWRRAWAAAGYAVLSLQPLVDDARAWQSELARSGEFKALGRQRYAAPLAVARMQVVAEIIEQARGRAAAGQPPWQRIDGTRVAIAGHDLGAYTAMVLAGEQLPGLAAPPTRWPIRAVVALSPYASAAGGALATRYLGIRVPVLSVTGDADTDLLGLVDSVALRGAPFEGMPGPDKFLLTLRGLTHAALGGAAARADGEATGRPPQGASRGDGDSGGPQRRGGRTPGGEGSGPQRQGSRRAAAPTGEGAVAARVAVPSQQLQQIAVQDVSTAFLDAYLRDDALARDWLSGHAPQWLGAAGTLSSK